MQARYQIRARAKIPGLSLATLRAWERRYQAVVPERTERVRQYGPAQIERLLLLRQIGSERACCDGIASLANEN
jgi:DNA-binding transcriptional MerR regulator